MVPFHTRTKDHVSVILASSRIQDPFSSKPVNKVMYLCGGDIHVLKCILGLSPPGLKHVMAEHFTPQVTIKAGIVTHKVTKCCSNIATIYPIHGGNI